MAVRPILRYPAAELTRRCEAVSQITDEIRAVAGDLADTLAAGPGVGIAAPQIGACVRMVLIDPERGKSKKLVKPQVLINPEITHAEGDKIFREGCLSVPEYTANILRFEKVSVRALDLDGREISIDADGFGAIVIQHELDHLDGVLFIHRVASKKDLFARKKF